MNREKLVSSTLKVTASEDLVLGPIQNHQDQKSIAELLHEQEKDQEEKDNKEEDNQEKEDQDNQDQEEEED